MPIERKIKTVNFTLSKRFTSLGGLEGRSFPVTTRAQAYEDTHIQKRSLLPEAKSAFRWTKIPRNQ